VLMNYSCISGMRLTLMAGSNRVLDDETQERRGKGSDLMRKAGSAALRS
jgi:hypothetical protein